MSNEKYRCMHHLTPPRGWMNDPNGTCFYNGAYHVFFQYTPENVNGGNKSWGHFISKDMINWEFAGIAINPDNERDLDGAYSGGALINDGKLELYYTGNVKEKGQYDYINEGRQHNVLRIKSNDGISFSEKELILTNEDYPEELSCHVRDPKMWQQDGFIWMMLGARTRDSISSILILKSADGNNWTKHMLYRLKSGQGYMFECPDYFKMGEMGVLAGCPQGIDSEDGKYQNIYNSGYYLVGKNDILNMNENELDALLKKDNFQEWDFGFDFYAPQTFEAADGRRIIVAWAGVPDSEYLNRPALEEGWQHCMTALRQLELAGGHIFQRPVREYEERLTGEKKFVSGETVSGEFDLTFECRDDINTSIGNDILLTAENHDVTLEFISEAGDGRKKRIVHLPEKIYKVRIIFDRSIMEIYINDGWAVMTTRYYPENPDEIKVVFEGVKKAVVQKMDEISIRQPPCRHE